MRRTIGVLVKEGSGAWPPPASVAGRVNFYRGGDAASLRAQTDTLDALVWVPGVAGAEATKAHNLKAKADEEEWFSPSGLPVPWDVTNPQIQYLMCLYFTLTTLTTVGYGDIAPQSPLGQFLASMIMIMGYGIIAVPTGIVTSEMSKQKPIDTNTQVCPNCLNSSHNEGAIFCHYCGKTLNNAN